MPATYFDLIKARNGASPNPSVPPPKTTYFDHLRAMQNALPSSFLGEAGAFANRLRDQAAASMLMTTPEELKNGAPLTTTGNATANRIADIVGGILGGVVSGAPEVAAGEALARGAGRVLHAIPAVAHAIEGAPAAARVAAHAAAAGAGMTAAQQATEPNPPPLTVGNVAQNAAMFGGGVLGGALANGGRIAQAAGTAGGATVGQLAAGALTSGQALGDYLRHSTVPAIANGLLMGGMAHTLGLHNAPEADQTAHVAQVATELKNGADAAAAGDLAGVEQAKARYDKAVQESAVASGQTADVQPQADAVFDHAIMVTPPEAVPTPEPAAQPSAPQPVAVPEPTPQPHERPAFTSFTGDKALTNRGVQTNGNGYAVGDIRANLGAVQSAEATPPSAIPTPQESAPQPAGATQSAAPASAHGDSSGSRGPTFRSKDGRELINTHQGTVPVAKPGELPPLDSVSRYREPLAQYSPSVYRETSADAAISFLPHGRISEDLGGPMYFANSPTAALGQGGNKGVVMRFDGRYIDGRLSKNKPAWQFAYNNGQAEFVGESSQEGYRNALESATVKPDPNRSRLDRHLVDEIGRTLTRQHWRVVNEPDGSVTYLRPDMEAGATPAQGSAPGSTGAAESSTATPPQPAQAAQPAEGTNTPAAPPAPATPPETTPQAPAFAPVATGATANAKTERGTTAQTQYALVNAPDLTASHTTNLQPNPSFPSELQPRDRTRAASELQVSKIAQNIEPSFLGASPKASEGAPIVGQDGIVESGNARTIALQRAYQQGTPSAGAYKSWLAQHASDFGLDPAAVQQMNAPVLVRVRTSDVNRPEFVRQANEQGTAAMSATEQATSDAGKLTGGMLARFVPSETGDLNTRENSGFVRDFMQNVVGPTESARYMTKDGALSQEGLTRIRNAVFAKAYGDTSALEKLAESNDNNVRNLTGAMLNAAPKLAGVKDQIEQGQLYPLDVTPDIAQAANKLSQLRAEGMSVEDYLKQGGLFGSDISPIAKDLLGVMDKYKLSRKKLTEVLSTYADIVRKSGNPAQGALFQNAKPTKPEVLQAAVNAVERKYAEPAQIALFQNAAGSGGDAGASGAGAGAEGGTAQGVEAQPQTAAPPQPVAPFDEIMATAPAPGARKTLPAAPPKPAVFRSQEQFDLHHALALAGRFLNDRNADIPAGAPEPPPTDANLAKTFEHIAGRVDPSFYPKVREVLDKYWGVTINHPQALDLPRVETPEQSLPAPETAARTTPPKGAEAANAEVAPGLPIDVSPNDIPAKSIMDAYRWNSFDPEKAVPRVQGEYVRHMRDVYDSLSPIAQTPEQQTLLRDEMQRYRDNYLKREGALLAARSRTASSMVTGGSNFPVAKNQKALDVESKRLKEAVAWDKAAQASIRKKLLAARNPEQTSNAEAQRLKKEIDGTVAAVKGIQTGEMKGFDKALFKQGLADKIRRSAENGNVDAVKSALDHLKEAQKGLQKPVFTPRHSVWNLLEEAQAAKSAEKSAPAGTAPVAKYNGAEVVNNHGAERVQIFLDEKPDDALKKALRGAGWNWSPSNGAWQRKNTANALASAKKIVGDRFGKE